MNKHVVDGPLHIPVLEMDADGYRRQCARLERLRLERDNEATTAALRAIQDACENNQNVMPALINAALADATLGEIMNVMRVVFGEYHEPVTI